jgi:hypothetical protein
MWEHRHLTTLWAFTACYRDSCTFFTFMKSCYFVFNHSVHLCPNLYSIFTIHWGHAPFSSLYSQLLKPPGLSLAASGLVLYSRGTDNAENTVLLLRSADHITSHVIAISPVHWHADCCLATSYKHSSYCCVRVSRGVYRAVAWKCVNMSQYYCFRFRNKW